MWHFVEEKGQRDEIISLLSQDEEVAELIPPCNAIPEPELISIIKMKQVF